MENEKVLDKIYEYYFGLLQPILKTISINVAKKLLNPQNTPVVKSFSTYKPFTILLSNYLTVGYIYGVMTHQDEIDLQVIENKVNFTSDWRSSFDGAREYFLKKNVVDIETFNRLNKNAKQSAFAIAKITDDVVTGQIKELMISAVDSGMDLKTFQGQVGDMLEKVGITPLNPYYMENVFRTNLFSVYNQARHDAGMQDDNTAGFRYISVNDSRTRPEHSALDGITAKKNDPIWDNIYPPIDYLCRCTTIPISLYYADKKNVKWGNYNKQKAIGSVGKNFKSGVNPVKNIGKGVDITRKY